MSDLLIIVFLLGGGTALLWLGAECLIRGGASFALRMGIPIMIVGLTIMGYGTGMPELVVSLQAGIFGKGDIAIGNVIGSNIANSALILGLAAFCRPIEVKKQFIVHDLPIMIFVTGLFWMILMFRDSIGRVCGLIFLLGIVVYSYKTVTHGMRNVFVIEMEKKEISHLRLKHWPLEIGLILIGFILLLAGGTIFLKGSILLAKMLHISDAVVAVTVVALGTSLPELAFTIIAIIRKHTDFVMGNVVGSNIFNILVIVGITALIHPVKILDITWFDYTYMLVLALLMWVIARIGHRISRIEGAFLLLSYCVFIVVQYWTLA